MSESLVCLETENQSVCLDPGQGDLLMSPPPEADQTTVVAEWTPRDQEEWNRITQPTDRPRTAYSPLGARPSEASIIPIFGLLAGCGAVSNAQGMGDSENEVGDDGLQRPRDAGPYTPDLPDSGPPVTYYQHVKPIFDAKCSPCHREGGIAPFDIRTYEEASNFAPEIGIMVTTGQMPPWPPSSECAPGGYVGDRSLTDEQIALTSAWVDGGALEGDPATEAPPLPSVDVGLSRTDLSLSMTNPYDFVGDGGPDDYRCFVIDWPEESTKFVTGFSLESGKPAIVHHAIAYLANPALAPEFEGRDEGSGYACFGGPGLVGDFVESSLRLGIVGTWAPGTQGKDYPEGTGIEINPGSKIVLQMHYHDNGSVDLPQRDQSTIQMSVEDFVERPAPVVFWADPRWMQKGGMRIADGEEDAVRGFNWDLTRVPDDDQYRDWPLPRHVPLMIYGAGLHMHRLGTAATLTHVVRDDDGPGESSCLLDIPAWDFHWQDIYFLNEPRPYAPGDSLGIECHWNNTEEFRSELDPPADPGDRTWGEGTEDEMCLGLIYATEAD